MEDEIQEHREWVEELEQKSQKNGSPVTSKRNMIEDSAFDMSFENERIEDIENNNEDMEEARDLQESLPVQSKRENQSNGKLNKKKKQTGEQTRWEQLYQLNKIQKETKEYFYQALKKDGEEKALDKCTFRPKLNKKSKHLNKRNVPGTFFERKAHWKQMKDEKLKQISENKQDKELLNCTFQPQILGISKAEKKRKELIGNKPAKALNKYIERQKQARKEKDRKKAILNGERSFDKRMGGTNDTYMSRFVKTHEGDEDGVLKKVRNCSFSNAVLCLHSHLNSFDVNLD